MEAIKKEKSIILNISEEEGIVLLEWLSNFNSVPHEKLFTDQAEERILFDLEAALEKVTSTTFENTYEDSLAKAREKIRDRE